MKWGAMIFGLLVVGNATASQLGCKCLLCLSNPAGPTAESECEPPIEELKKRLKKGKPFPKCDMSDGNDGSSWAQQTLNPYDLCPAGSKPAPANSAVALGAYDPIWKKYKPSSTVEISEPDTDDGGFISPSSLGPQACVGNKVGSYYDFDAGYSVGLYDSVAWQAPNSNPRAIDVYIDYKLYKRVRF